MTEAEAKTKACPRAATFGASQQLADGPGPHCVASACMAWRWFGTNVRNSDLAEPHPGVDPNDLVRSTRTHGCCGLAGDWFGQMRGVPREDGVE